MLRVENRCLRDSRRRALLGCVVVGQFRSSPFYTLPILDEESCWEWAKTIASGDVLGKKTAICVVESDPRPSSFWMCRMSAPPASM